MSIIKIDKQFFKTIQKDKKNNQNLKVRLEFQFEE